MNRTGPVKWFSGPVQFKLNGQTSPVEVVFLGVSHFFKHFYWTGPDQSSDPVVQFSLNWTDGLVQLRTTFWGGLSFFFQFHLDRTRPVQWSSGPVQFELDGRTGPVEGVFLGGVSQFFFSISSGPDRTSPVIQWSGPVWTGRTDRSDWRRLSRGVHPYF